MLSLDWSFVERTAKHLTRTANTVQASTVDAKPVLLSGPTDQHEEVTAEHGQLLQCSEHQKS